MRLAVRCAPWKLACSAERLFLTALAISVGNSQVAVAYPGILFGRGSTNSVEDRGQRERGSEGGSPLVMGSGGSCNLIQEI